MSENEIKSIFKKYKLISTGALLAFMLLAIYLNQYLTNRSIERHYELELPYAATESGYVWPTIIMGLFIVLHLCFYSFEKIMIKLLTKSKHDSE